MKPNFLTVKQFNDLSKTNWIKAAEYLLQIKNTKIYKLAEFNDYDDFLLSKNYLFSLDKAKGLIKCYNKYIKKFKLKKEYLYFYDYEILISLLPIINKNNYKEWIKKLKTTTVLEIESEIESEIIQRKYKEILQFIQGLNNIIVSFNDFVLSFESLLSMWKVLPIENRKVAKRVFKENIIEIIKIFKEME